MAKSHKRKPKEQQLTESRTQKALNSGAKGERMNEKQKNQNKNNFWIGFRRGGG